MEYDKEKYKAWKLPHPLLLHWILNPGLAFNELILGQRLPKLTLIDKTSNAPLMERQYVPCPSCNALNDGRLWAKGNAMGNWFGYICPECGEKIPCLWNITSIVLLVLTFPVWIWIKLFFEEKWVEKERLRFSNVESIKLPEAKTISWIKMGAMFGFLMFCFMSLPQILMNRMPFTNIAIQIVIWAVAGLFFGLVMKFILGRRKKA